MKRILSALGVGAVILCLFIATRAYQEHSREVNLATSKRLNLPVPGFVASTNGYPATIALSPDGRYAALLNEGYGNVESGVRQSIGILNLRTNQFRDFPDDRLRGDEKTTLQSYFVGLGFSRDGQRLYASLSALSESGIAVYKFSNGEVIPESYIKIPAQPLPAGKELVYDAGKIAARTAPAYPAGFALLPSRQGDQLLIADNLADRALLLEVSSGKVLKSFDLSRSKYVPASYPYTVVANQAGTKAWVSLWNASAVAELNLQTGDVGRWIDFPHPSDPTAAGVHPTTLLLNHAENMLYVSLSNASSAQSDGVAAVDLETGRKICFFHVALKNEARAGATPIGIVLSPDEAHLYVTSASLNGVAVFEVNRNSGGAVSPSGFIPTLWYPAAVAIAGNDLLITTAKGAGTGPNSMQATIQTELHPNPHPYIATLLSGSLQRLSLADIQKNLAAYTQQVEENNLRSNDSGKIDFAAGKDPIRHVIYILKENRTYDQILGDLPAGNGEPSLTLWGADITPNEHKLALQFGVLDNFYDSGEVSANGHLWSDASAASDYMEKIWPILYRGAERPEDYGNQLNQGIPDMDDPGTGFIWDNLAQHNFTYRIYGEMLDATWCPASPQAGATDSACPSAEIRQGEPLPANVGNPLGGPSPWPWPVPRFKEAGPTKTAQRGHIDPFYADFNIQYPDQFRVDEFLREFRQFIAARGTSKELPQFVELWLPNDHTGGTRVGKPSPRASVADNDLAVGRIVEAVSHSPYWDDTAIFVVEDDAQNGSDHVDAHRTTALVISKYSPRADTPFVDHHFYTTVGMMHTMETLLGLPPMNLFDADSPVIAPLFEGPGTQPAYQADDRNLRSGLLYEMNRPSAPGGAASEKLDFSRPDVVDPKQLNAILWQDAKESARQTGRGTSAP
ncbi:MAG TPA: phosphoesterase [Terriglobales bacterium]